MNQNLLLRKICLLDNEDLVNKYLKHPNIENSKLLFHGTNTKWFSSIFKKGFILSSKLIGKLYGKGNYFTSSPLHAINYLVYCKRGGNKSTNKCTLISAYCNLGKINVVKDYSSRNKALPTEVDTNCVQVTS